ncbi:MAG: hypothetical protein U0O05_05325 [Dorea phocaeensis]
MRKRILSILLVGILVGSLTACGGGEKTASDKTGQNNTQTIQLSGIEFKVPETWKVVENPKYESDETVKTFKSDDIYLKVIYGSNSIVNKSNKLHKAYLSGLGTRLDNFEIGEIEDVNFDGKPAKKAEISFEVDSNSYTGFDITLEFADFIFGVKKSASSNHEEDIKKVVESAKEIEYEKKADKTLNYLLLSDGIRWNMAEAETKDLETRTENTIGSFENGNMSYLNYSLDPDTDKYSSSTNCVYAFMDNQLKAYWTTFESPSFSDYKGVYEEIKSFISEKYGNCENEEITWSDTTYQNKPDKWNDAFKYGYVTIKTTWHTADSAIIIDWAYDKMNVIISSLEFENNL